MQTLFGCSAPALAGEAGPDAITRVAKTFNPTVVRLYLEGPDGPKLDARCTAALHTGASLSVSWKKWDDTQVRTFIDSLPKDRLTIVTYFHEPEDNVEDGSLKIEDWRARTIKLCQIIKDAGRVGQVRPAVILMAWSANPVSKRHVSDFATPEVTQALVDAKGIWGWDDYLNGSNDFKADFTNLARISASYGLPWGVFETGVDLKPSPDMKALAAFWPRVFAYLGSGQVTPPVAFLYWNANTANHSYAIDVYPALMDAWKQAPALFAGGHADPPADPPGPTGQPTPKTYTQDQLDAAVAAAVAPLNSQVSTLTDELSTEHAHSADLDSQLAAAQATVAGDQSHLTDLQAQLGTANAAVADCQRQLSAVNAQVVTLQQQAAASDAARVKSQGKLRTLLTAADAFAAAVAAAKKP